MENPEQQVYQTIYDAWEPGQYGSSNHGNKFFDPMVKHLNIESVLDVGCGYNHFSNGLKNLGIRSEGVDFACPGADRQADILFLPYENNEWEWITAWDVLEHLLPIQIDAALQEMARVSKHFAFTIAYKLAVTVAPAPFEKHNLHQTIWTPKEWRMHLEQYAEVKNGPESFWMGTWKQ